MQNGSWYENYPVTTVIVSGSVSLLIYGIGVFLLLQYDILFALTYLTMAGILELRLISSHCPHGYYYQKTCAFGKGRLSALLVSKGDPSRFGRREISWKDLLLVFLMLVIPALAGVYLLTREFSVIVLVRAALLFVLGFAGNAFVRGSLACRYCMQREIGCPAEQLFSQDLPEKTEAP